MVPVRRQKKAIEWLYNSDKPALQLIAGAGSGKTGTIIEAAALAAKRYTSASKIGMVTFTRKAAAEMKERLVSRGIVGVYTGTMHSLAFRLASRSGLIRGTLLENDFELKQQVLRDLCPEFSHIPAEIVLGGKILSEQDVRRFNEEYQVRKKNLQQFDFDDLIMKVAHCPPEQPPFEVLFVDEFQDTSPDQVEFIKALNAKRVICVGDDWQSIYKFRGADVRVSLNFNHAFPRYDKLFLTENFRSQKRIVKLGNKAIRLSSQYVKKRLTSHFKAADKPALFIQRLNREADLAEILQNYYKKIEKERKRRTIETGITFLVRTNYILQKLKPFLRSSDTILTIHSAKGLEFEQVTVFGIAEHILPHRWGDEDEETRLLYVAITRARQKLHFVAWAEIRSNSRFLPFLAKECKTFYLN